MKDERRTSVAHELRRARKLSGLSVSAVAKQAGLDRTTISTYEAQRAAASEAALARWSHALEELARRRRADVQTALNDLEGLARTGGTNPS